jgi:hypothetical protein
MSSTGGSVICSRLVGLPLECGGDTPKTIGRADARQRHGAAAEIRNRHRERDHLITRAHFEGKSPKRRGAADGIKYKHILGSLGVVAYGEEKEAPDV